MSCHFDTDLARVSIYIQEVFAYRHEYLIVARFLLSLYTNPFLIIILNLEFLVFHSIGLVIVLDQNLLVSLGLAIYTDLNVLRVAHVHEFPFDCALVIIHIYLF